jgi:hypothetical protein
MTTENLQSDQFQELLAEALRAGPGSPAWKQAVETLRNSGQAGEEYAMLCRAREDLESGRNYRSIKAGPGFTQKLMTQLDGARESRWNFATANVITGLAISVIVILITVALYLAFNPARSDRSATELAEMFFTNTRDTNEFSAAVAPGYARIGALPLLASDGLRVEAKSPPGDQYLGGGVYGLEPLTADQVVAVETAIAFANQDTDVIAQLFITDTPEFAAATGLSPQELVCLIEAARVRALLPDGTTAGEMPLVLNEQSAAHLRIRLSRTAAVVEHNNKVIWSGQHQLAEQPRYVGVRFLTRGAKDAAESPVAVKYLRIMQP